MATAVKRDVVEAFKSIGVDDERAWKAAEALSGTEERLTQMEARLDQRIAQVEQRIAQVEIRLIERISQIEATLGQRITKVEGRLDLLTWMVGTSMALSVGILLKLFAT